MKNEEAQNAREKSLKKWQYKEEVEERTLGIRSDKSTSFFTQHCRGSVEAKLA